MSNVPYNQVTRASIGALSSVTWTPFWNTPVIRKRQLLSSNSKVFSEDLLRKCQLDHVRSSDVAAGCVAGIYYNRYCTIPSNSSMLKQCHEAYDKVFADSVFKPLGEFCRARKKGPFSSSCASVVNVFSAVVSIGNDPEGRPTFLPLGKSVAVELVNNIFAQPKYAPCQAPFTCNWWATKDWECSVFRAVSSKKKELRIMS